MRHVLLLASFAVGLVLAACGGHNGNGPCVGANPDPTCSQTCDGANPCPDGFFCADDGTCNAECTPDGMGCASAEHCGTDGHCEPNVDADCPNVTLNGERTTPTVELLLDQSGSMTQNFGGVSRYTAMRNALVGSTADGDPVDGIVTTTAASVIFGAALYTGVAGTCPRTITAPRALSNLTAIGDLLDNNAPATDTPTGESIDVIVNDFAANPPAPDSPQIIILATDGEPDSCAIPNPANDTEADATRLLAIDAAKRAFQMGIRLYILGVSGDVGEPHLQDMANAGVGNDPAVTHQDAPYFQADNPTELAQQLEQIVGGVLSCELVLDGTVDQAAFDSGVVVLNGRTLVEGTDWVVVDGNTIRLIDAACDELTASSNPTVSATFPCGVVVN